MVNVTSQSQPAYFGVLCPLRFNAGKLEVLLTRRAFFSQDKPFSFPGEWVFPGGGYKQGDRTTANTAIREFREECKYRGALIPKLLRGNTNGIDFYTTWIDHPEKVGVSEEVIDFAWKRPQDWLQYLTSESYVQKQERALSQHHLQRQVPLQTLGTLEYLDKIYGGN